MSSTLDSIAVFSDLDLQPTSSWFSPKVLRVDLYKRSLSFGVVT